MTTIHVCIGSACHLKGAYNIITGLQNLITERALEDRITVKAAFCLGECTKAVSVKVDDLPILSVCEKTVTGFFDEHVCRRL